MRPQIATAASALAGAIGKAAAEAELTLVRRSPKVGVAIVENGTEVAAVNEPAIATRRALAQSAPATPNAPVPPAPASTPGATQALRSTPTITVLESAASVVRPTAEVAQSPRELQAALRLVHDEYVAKGYLPPSSVFEQWRHPLFAEGRAPITLLQTEPESARTVATTSVLVDRAGQTLPADGRHGAFLSAAREAGVRGTSDGEPIPVRFMEIGALATAQSARPEIAQSLLGNPQMVELFRGVIAVARQEGATHLIAEVNPSHVSYYVGMLGFRIVTDPTKPLSAVMSTPVMGPRDAHALAMALQRGELVAGYEGLRNAPAVLLVREVHASNHRLARLIEAQAAPVAGVPTVSERLSLSTRVHMACVRE